MCLNIHFSLMTTMLPLKESNNMTNDESKILVHWFSQPEAERRFLSFIASKVKIIINREEKKQEVKNTPSGL